MTLKVGDHVSKIDEPIDGHILSVDGHTAEVLWSDGFEERLLIKKITLKKTFEIEEIQVKDQLVSPILVARKIEEIDLHFDKIEIKHHLVPKYEILIRQLNYFYEEVQRAKKEKLDTLIVIHGRGEGVLREELIAACQKIDHIYFETAQDKKYRGNALAIHFLNHDHA